MKKIAAVLVSAIMLCAPASAYAGCVQSDLAGTWQLYESHGSGWNRCTLVIRKGGSIDSATCRTSLEEAKPLIGRFTLESEPHCTFSAELRIGGSVLELSHATLSRDKLTAVGVGSIGSTAFTVVMSKR
jgi:hypothetical protein